MGSQLNAWDLSHCGFGITCHSLRFCVSEVHRLVMSCFGCYHGFCSAIGVLSLKMWVCSHCWFENFSFSIQSQIGEFMGAVFSRNFVQLGGFLT